LTLAASSSSSQAVASQSQVSLLRQLIERSAGVTKLKAAPLANDTVSAAYWAKIDAAIATASATTFAPGSSETTAIPGAWEKVFRASRPGGETSAEDLTPDEAASRAALETQDGLKPGTDLSAGIKKPESLVPYDMQLGARIMNGLTPQNTQAPPPLQSVVTDQFVAQCPMVMFAKSLHISAPKCGETMGMWMDPSSHRGILRWEPAKYGGVHFGVDSVVSGPGSATFAEIGQEMSLNGNYFELTNCLNVKRYTIQEEVVQVDHIGMAVTSSAQDHDVSRTGKAWFYKYKIVAPNGTLVAQSNLFRQGQDTVNFTSYVGEVTNGPTIAQARRVGTWKASDWRKCSASERAWQVDFAVSSRDLDTVATVMDLRVASAAALTLMAFREEAISEETGQNRLGELDMVKGIVGSIATVILVIALFVSLVMLIRFKGWDQRLRRCCFKVEAVCLPKRPAWKRNPPLNTTH
jgi:hypothetical protein